MGPIAIEAGGERLDRALAQALPQFSRSRLKAMIEAGQVRDAEGTACRDPARKVRVGERFWIDMPPPEPAEPEAQALPLSILYEDEHLLVVDKPAGLVVHPAPGNPDRTLVNALLAHCGASLRGIGGVARPGIVHRLDKDTSGLMVVAKTQPAHDGLVRALAARQVTRIYQALVLGVPNPPAGRIEGAIGRSSRDRKKMAVLATGGRAALTHYRTLRRFGTSASLLECRLETGRTHQIRVHLAHIGHPVLGDPLYVGRRKIALDCLRPRIAAFGRQALHAVSLRFTHPVSGVELSFSSPRSEDIEGLIADLEGSTEGGGDE